MEIRSTESVSLVGVSTPAAKSAAVHEMSMDGGVMRMRPVEKLDLEADKAVALAPGGYHLMLEGLKKPLHKGESVPLSLVFEGKDGKRFNVEAKAKVLGLTEAAPPAMAPTPRP
jgi:copper(I)-binding protein